MEKNLTLFQSFSIPLVLLWTSAASNQVAALPVRGQGEQMYAQVSQILSAGATSRS